MSDDAPPDASTARAQEPSSDVLPAGYGWLHLEGPPGTPGDADVRGLATHVADRIREQILAKVTRPAVAEVMEQEGVSGDVLSIRVQGGDEVLTCFGELVDEWGPWLRAQPTPLTGVSAFEEGVITRY